MSDYFLLCLFCIFLIIFTVSIERSSLGNLAKVSLFTKLCLLFFILPLLPILIGVFFTVKLVRND